MWDNVDYLFDYSKPEPNADRIPPYFHGPRFPYKRLQFLQPVKVRSFIESHVWANGFHDNAYRIIETYTNKNHEHIFYVVGQAHKAQGKIIKATGGGEDYEPGCLYEKSRHFIVKLQGGMNYTRMALLEDIIELDSPLNGGG